MIVITLLFGVFYLVDLQRPLSRFEPYDPRLAESLLQNNSSIKSCDPVPEKNKEDDWHPLEKSVPLYIITATYPRLEQLAELTRLGQTLKNVPNMRWIVADDAANPTKQISSLLYRLNITYKYILGQFLITFLVKDKSEKYFELCQDKCPKGIGLGKPNLKEQPTETEP